MKRRRNDPRRVRLNTALGDEGGQVERGTKARLLGVRDGMAAIQTKDRMVYLVPTGAIDKGDK